MKDNDNKLDNHEKILEGMLIKDKSLNDDERKKLRTYFKEFCRYLE